MIHVTCAIIRDSSDRILLARRPEGKHLAGFWEFPGGKIENGESAADCLHREIREELACEITHLQALPSVTHRYDWGEIQLHPFRCQLTTSSPPPQPLEHSELTWCQPSELHQYQLAPADITIVAML